MGARVRAGAHPRRGVAADTARSAGQPAARHVRVRVGVRLRHVRVRVGVS